MTNSEDREMIISDRDIYRIAQSITLGIPFGAIHDNFISVGMNEDEFYLHYNAAVILAVKREE